MTKNEHELRLLERILDQKTIENLRDIAILKDQDTGSYILYGEYEIAKSNNMFRVTKINTERVLDFSSIKHATAWAIFDKRNMLYQSSRLIELEYRLASLEVNIQLHGKMKSSSKDDSSYLLYSTKLSEDRLKKKKYLSEIDRYISDVKHWQLRKFDATVKKK